MRLADAHCHLAAGQEPLFHALLANGGYRIAFSVSGTPEEQSLPAVLALRKAYPKQAVYTAGVHPWHAGRVQVETLEPAMEKAALVGEIGLDEGWANVPMDTQLAAYRVQLAWARRHGKGVVLHLHNQEALGLRVLREYALPKVLVHWYAGDAGVLDELAAMGCWFTVGPDFTTNPGVRQVIQRIPLGRLLIETDGLEALQWALPHTAPDLTGALRSAVHAIATAKGIPLRETEAALWENFEILYFS